MKQALLAGLGGIILGCSSAETYTPQTVNTPQAATILGPSPAKGKKGHSWVNTVAAINGKRIADPFAATTIAAGKYRLTLRCKKTKKIVLESTVELEAVAGVQYEVAVDHGRQRCVIVRSR